MRKNKYVSRILAAVLGVSILAAEMPLNVYATDTSIESDGMEWDVKEPVIEEVEIPEPYIVGEVTEECTETTKMFRLSDGSYKVATYEQPIHYEDEQGKFQEIDNTFEEAVVTYGSGDERVYRNRAGNRNIQFKERTQETEIPNEEKRITFEEVLEKETEEVSDEVPDKVMDEILQENFLQEVSIEVAGQVVSWTYEGMSEGAIEWEESESSELTDDEKFLTVSKAVSSGKYREAFPYTDIQYIISPEGIKENIILKERQADHIWKLKVDIGTFTAVQTDPHTVELHNETKEPVMIIAAPLMTDAEGRISTEVTLSMEVDESTMCLTVTADKEFLQNDETVYPVTVDPYFYLAAKTDISISDTFVSSAKPTTNMRVNGMASGSLIVGNEASTYGKTRSLLKMDSLPELPAGSVITEADLILLNYYSYSAGKSMTIDVRRATSAWAQKTATWNNSSNIYESVIQNYKVVPQNEHPSGVFDTWEITRLVKGWYEGNIPNYGLMLTAFAAETASPAQCTKYYSSNSLSYGGLYPTFLIAFRSNAGLEEYWTYHEQAVDGGYGYINDYSGNLVFSVPILGTTGGNQPTDISFVYNGHICYKQYQGSAKGAINGAGWMTTYGQRLDKVTNIPQFNGIAEELVKQGFDYVWLDQDGTYHFFKKQSDGTYKDEDGLGLTLKIGQTDPNYPYPGLNVIEDKNGNRTVFMSTGYLLFIADHLNQRIIFHYDGTGKLLDVKDGAGRKITFEYYSTTITGITGPEETIKFKYSGANLIGIDFPDGTQMKFDYSVVTIGGTAYNLLSTVTGRDGMKIAYTYPGQVLHSRDAVLAGRQNMHPTVQRETALKLIIPDRILQNSRIIKPVER